MKENTEQVEIEDDSIVEKGGKRYIYMENGRVRDFIKKRAENGKWWILLAGDEWAREVIVDILSNFPEIEETGSSRDVELLQPYTEQGIVIVLCKKSRLSPRQLLRAISRHDVEVVASKRELAKKTVISLSADEFVSKVIQAIFFMWLSGKIGKAEPSLN